MSKSKIPVDVNTKTTQEEKLLQEKRVTLEQAKSIRNFPGVVRTIPFEKNLKRGDDEHNNKQPLDKILIVFNTEQHRNEFIERHSLPKNDVGDDTERKLLYVTPEQVKTIHENWLELRKQQLANKQKFKENLLQERQTSKQPPHSLDKNTRSASEVSISPEKLGAQLKLKEELAAQKKNKKEISLMDRFMLEFEGSLQKSKILGITPPSQLMEKYNHAKKNKLTFTIDDVLSHIRTREGKSCRSKEVLGNIIGKEKLESLIKNSKVELESSKRDESRSSFTCF